MLKSDQQHHEGRGQEAFAQPRSVAKYQPKRISKPSPMKNVSAGLILFSCRI